MNYLNQRLSKLGNVKELSSFKTLDYNTKKEEERTLLSSDEHDNINIHYHGLHGSPWVYDHPTRKYTEQYIRKRIKNPKNSNKYFSPKGAGLLPFFLPNLINKFRNKTKIKTLFLVEGEFKAIALSINNIDVIGLGSIHGFYAPQNTDRNYYKEFAPEILEVIKECEVENLVYLTDADTISINYEADKELSNRPNSFCKAVINFRDIVKRIISKNDNSLKNYYYSHIKQEFNPNTKGIDDVLISFKEKKNGVLEDLLLLDKSNTYFKTFDLSQTQDVDLKRYFGLNGVDNFYNVYKSFIGNREFDFKRVKYYYDGENIKILKNKNYDDYLRVGSNYYKTFAKPKMVEGLLVKSQVIIPWLKGEISTDFGKIAFDYIKKYNDFVNVPNWLNYKSEIDNCYNVCKPLAYKPVKGDISNSIKFFNHIANDSSFIKLENGIIKENPKLGNTGTMLLDYLSIMFKYPTQLLPAPCLLSKEQETGKTTFAQLVYYMFEGNSTIIQTKE